MSYHCPKFKFGTDDTIYRHEDGTAIPADEPVFLIRGKDEVAPWAIREYIRIMEQFPDSILAKEHAESARERLETIEQWQTNHPERVGMGCHTCEHLPTDQTRERLFE